MICCRLLLLALCLIFAFYAGEALENHQTFTLSITSGEGAAPFAGMKLDSAVEPRRTKREVIKLPLPDPGDCMLECTKEAGEKYDRNNYHGDNSKVSFNIFNYLSDVDKLVDFCKIYAPLGSCFSYCPDSRLKTLMTELQDFAMLACQWSANNYTDLKNTINYWQSEERSKVTEDCATRCTNVTDLPSGNINVNVDVSHTTTQHNRGSKCWITETQSRSVIYDNNSTRNTEFMRRWCSVYNCQRDCSKPVREKLFGSRIVAMDDGFNATVIKGLLNSLKEMNAIDYEPIECKPVILAAPEVKKSMGDRPPAAQRSTSRLNCNSAIMTYPSSVILMFATLSSLYWHL